MKTQTLYKRLSLPLLLTVISASGIGVTPARSASLISSQNTILDVKPETILIAQRCPYGMKPEFDPPCHSSWANIEISPDHEQTPSENSSKERGYQHSQQRRLKQQRSHQQRELEQQRSQQQRELEQQPTVESSRQNQ